MSEKIRVSGDQTKTLTCARCDAPVVADFKPFCSKRCADVDLGQWLTGSYSIPANEPPDNWIEPAEPGEDDIRWRH